MVCIIVALFAVEFMANVALATFRRENPGPGRPWWIMPYVLRMTAIQIGHPMHVFIRVESCNAAYQGGLAPF